MQAEEIARLLEAWDRVDRAAQGVSTALPAQMTEAADRLERERLAFRAALHRFALLRERTAPEGGE